MQHLRQLAWVGSSKTDLKRFPESVQREIGYALHLAQAGDMSDKAKPLKRLGTGMIEIVSNYDTNTFRAVYALKIGQSIYVLHCFQKKSKRSIKTPKNEVDLIKQRFKLAKVHAQTKQAS